MDPLDGVPSLSDPAVLGATTLGSATYPNTPGHNPLPTLPFTEVISGSWPQWEIVTTSLSAGASDFQSFAIDFSLEPWSGMVAAPTEIRLRAFDHSTDTQLHDSGFLQIPHGLPLGSYNGTQSFDLSAVAPLQNLGAGAQIRFEVLFAMHEETATLVDLDGITITSIPEPGIPGLLFTTLLLQSTVRRRQR